MECWGLDERFDVYARLRFAIDEAWNSREETGHTSGVVKREMETNG
jgi:hypothetical protein